MPKSKETGGAKLPLPPKNPADFSSNWKQLQMTLGLLKKRKAAEESDTSRIRKRPKLDSPSRRNNTKGSEKSCADKNGTPGSSSTSASLNKSEEKPDIWFDDVDEMLLERPAGAAGDRSNPLQWNDAVTHATKALAMDCEMVGVGLEGKESVLARVSLVNQHGRCMYDKFVKPREKVTDFRTKVSGVRPRNLINAEEFLVVQKEVSDLLKGKLLVGHALKNDLKVLFLDHPRADIRDTARFKPFRQLFKGRTPSLKNLTAQVLGVKVQQGEHSSVQDAQAAMRLYMTYRKRWEKELSVKTMRRKRAIKKKQKQGNRKQESIQSKSV